MQAQEYASLRTNNNRLSATFLTIPKLKTHVKNYAKCYDAILKNN